MILGIIVDIIYSSIRHKIKTRLTYICFLLYRYVDNIILAESQEVYLSTKKILKI